MDDFMRRYAVLHANDLMAMVEPRGSYTHTHVADVDAHSASEVFEITNHTEQNWTSRPEVVWFFSGRELRSTSVGDVIYLYETERAFLVMPTGFLPCPIPVLEGDV